MHAATVSDLKRNSFFHRPSKLKKEKKPLGLFHQFEPALRKAIVRAAMIKAPATWKSNHAALESQAAARQAREAMVKEKNLSKATDEYIEAMYLIEMYNSDACVKGDPKQVTSILKKLGSDTAKKRFLKTNINIRVKGFG